MFHFDLYYDCQSISSCSTVGTLIKQKPPVTYYEGNTKYKITNRKLKLVVLEIMWVIISSHWSSYSMRFWFVRQRFIIVKRLLHSTINSRNFVVHFRWSTILYLPNHFMDTIQSLLNENNTIRCGYFGLNQTTFHISIYID